jgi:hypothetical protein
MKNRIPGEWIAAATMAAVLIVPCVAAAGQEFALGSQPREQSTRQQERPQDGQARERAELERDRAQQTRERFENAYAQGQNAIERAQWQRAIERFSMLVDAKAPRADAALYWRAYSLDKVNRPADALTSVAELLKAYPSSRWAADARALEIQVRQRVGQPVSPDVQSDEELKLLAIMGLQHQDRERAIAMLEQLLQSTNSPRIKERALFVLAQTDAARAREVMTTVARSASNPELQMKAIQYIGMMTSQPNRRLLGEIYTSSSDIDVKRQILRAYVLSNDRERVLAAATGEKAPQLRAEAVRQLGMMGARDDVWQLYRKEPDAQLRTQMIQGLFMAGDSTHLLDIANNDANLDLRQRAIQQLGMMGRDRTGDALLSIYNRHMNTDIREGVIDALFIQQNDDALVALAKKEADRDLKRRIVSKLAQMQSPAARDYMMELLK